MFVISERFNNICVHSKRCITTRACVCDSFFHLKAENKIYLFRNIFFSLLKEVLMPTLRFLALKINKSFNRNLVQTNYKTFWWKIYLNSSTSYLDSIIMLYFFQSLLILWTKNSFFSIWKPNLFELSLKVRTYLKVLILQ